MFKQSRDSLLNTLIQPTSVNLPCNLFKYICDDGESIDARIDARNAFLHHTIIILNSSVYHVTKDHVTWWFISSWPESFVGEPFTEHVIQQYSPHVSVNWRYGGKHERLGVGLQV